MADPAVLETTDERVDCGIAMERVPKEPCADRRALERLARLALRALGAARAEVHLWRDGRYEPTALAVDAVGPPPMSPRDWHRDERAEALMAATTGEPPATWQQELGGASLASCAAVPLRSSAGELLGALCVGGAAGREWAAREIETLRDIAATAAEDIELRRELARRAAGEEAAAVDALHDPLTQLPNRLLFMERLEHAIARARRRDEAGFAVLFLDLDRFKLVNDSLGHLAGDELLVAVAARLKASVRLEDTVARLGGDEFAMLLEDVVDITYATRVAERILDVLGAPVNLSGYEVFTSTSIGIALSSSAYRRPEYLLRNADMAMYRAKAAGPGKFEVFDRAMHAEALARLQLETDLRRAVEQGEFHLHYQPIVGLETGTITGMEALLRWHHPAQGSISPVDFIPVAEETGLILPLGAWVLREACRQAREWQDRLDGERELTISVNLSVKQFAQPDLVEQVRAVLQETGLAPGSLKLEITESVIVRSADDASRVLRELKQLGVQICMDDFGTGYSSLGYLHRLPLDTLKIDRSFIGAMGTERKTYQLVQTIVTLAQGVGMNVVAEGVELDAQLCGLRALGCSYGQGFLFAGPLAPADAELLLQRAPRW